MSSFLEKINKLRNNKLSLKLMCVFYSLVKNIDISMLLKLVKLNDIINYQVR